MLRLFLAFALAVLSAPALAQDNAAAPLPLPTTKFTFNPTAQQNYCQVFYTTIPAGVTPTFNSCTTPAFALAIVFKSIDIVPASTPVGPRPCRKPDSLEPVINLDVHWPQQPMLDGNSSFCAYQNLLSTCYTESVNVFLSYSTYWNGTYTENNVVKPIPETSFNKSEPRQLTAIVGNETGAQCRPITTTTTARATATATATLRPASAAGLRAGAQWALGVGAAVLAVWA